MCLDLKESLERQDHRVPVVHWDLWALQESQVEGVDPEQMEREECLGRPDRRVTEDLMVLLVCLVKKATGVRRDLRAHRDLQEKTEKEVTMVRLDPGVCLESQVLVVCWAPKVPRVPQDLPV